MVQFLSYQFWGGGEENGTDREQNGRGAKRIKGLQKMG